MKKGFLACALVACIAVSVLTACSGADQLEDKLKKVMPDNATVEVKDGDDGKNSYDVSIKYTAQAAPDTQQFANIVRDVLGICDAPPDAKMRIQNINIKMFTGPDYNDYYEWTRYKEFGVEGTTLSDGRVSATTSLARNPSIEEIPAILNEAMDPAAEAERKATHQAEINDYILASDAVAKAQQYVNTGGVSRTWLISQLQQDGFTQEQATSAVDSKDLLVNWKQQAALHGQVALAMEPALTREELYQELIAFGFTPEQAEHGVHWNFDL